MSSNPEAFEGRVTRSRARAVVDEAATPNGKTSLLVAATTSKKAGRGTKIATGTTPMTTARNKTKISSLTNEAGATSSPDTTKPTAKDQTEDLVISGSNVRQQMQSLDTDGHTMPDLPNRFPSAANAVTTAPEVQQAPSDSMNQDGKAAEEEDPLGSSADAQFWFNNLDSAQLAPPDSATMPIDGQEGILNSLHIVAEPASAPASTQLSADDALMPREVPTHNCCSEPAEICVPAAHPSPTVAAAPEMCIDEEPTAGAETDATGQEMELPNLGACSVQRAIANDEAEPEKLVQVAEACDAAVASAELESAAIVIPAPASGPASPTEADEMETAEELGDDTMPLSSLVQEASAAEVPSPKPAARAMDEPSAEATPIRGIVSDVNKPLRTPMSAVAGKNAPRVTIKAPLTAAKPSARARSSTEAPAAAKAHTPSVFDRLSSAASKSASVSTITPGASAKPGGKRVSISTPCRTASTTVKHVVRTPYPKAGAGGDAMDADDMQVIGSGAAINDGLDVTAALGESMDIMETCMQDMPASDGAQMATPWPSSGAELRFATAGSTLTPEFVPLPKSALKSKPVSDTPGTAAKYNKAKEHLKAMATAETGMHLTIPMETASFMAGTKSSMMKTKPKEEPAATTDKAKLKSKVVVPEAYDHRSLKELKREVKAKLAEKDGMQKPKGLTTDDGDDETEAKYDQATEAMLVSAMSNKLDIDPSKKQPLRGVPLPMGQHIRFDDDGQAVPSPSSGRPVLRGLPAPAGSHMRFD